MSLISFPQQYENLKNKLFTVGPQVSIPNGFKSEIGYTVPSNRKSTISLNFSGLLVGQVSTAVSTLNTYPMVISDFLKPGDVVYAGYSYVDVGGGAGTVTFNWFYNLNGVTVHSDSYSIFVGSSGRRMAVSTTIHVLEFDK